MGPLAQGTEVGPFGEEPQMLTSLHPPAPWNKPARSDRRQRELKKKLCQIKIKLKILPAT